MFRSFNFICFLLLFFVVSYSFAVARDHGHRRRILHQPFFPRESVPSAEPPGSSPQPQPSPKQQPKLPFSSGSSSSSSSSSASGKPFFPSLHSPPPPPSPVPLTTLPANISSLLLPPSSSSSSSSHHHPIIAVAVSVSLFSAALLAALTAFAFHRRHGEYTIPDKTSRSDSLRLYPPNTATSDGSRKPRGGTPSSTSSEFLYMGTVVNSRDEPDNKTIANSSNATSAPPPLIQYQKLGSPELKPLPPLPRRNFRQSSPNAKEEDDDEDEEFFSPRGSSGRKQSPPQQLTGSSSRGVFQLEANKFGSRSFNSRTPSYPCSNSASPANSVSFSSSPPLSFSPRNLKPHSPDTMADFPIPSRPFTQQPISASTSPSLSSVSSPMGNVSRNARNSPARTNDISGQGKTFPATIPVKLPPPPPPPPPPRFWEIPVTAPTTNVSSENLKPVSSAAEQVQHGIIENPKPKLKALHWDKVRASSDRAMVWDQIKPSSFQLNEEMIETLFMVNNSNFSLKDNGRRQNVAPSPTENRVLDPKKSQNIAILLRALNVTIDEVCESLREGNCDALGTELLESLLKMAPTKEEECKLKEFKDETPLKLGPAEKFLKVMLDIPFAFKRVEAMLYIANFDSELEYLKKSFETLEVACGELRNSRMFLKLLEAVLKTGNRMNVGTNRGDALAFKLDTLLKLADIKGTDGKTSLLHFVVQEIVRTEGSRISGVEDIQQSSLQDEVEFRKLGLQVVSGLSGELTNVKKAAAMDSEMLESEVAKLAGGIAKVAEVIKLNEETPLKETSRKFSEAMEGFLKKGEEDIVKIQAQEKNAFGLVKEITEYFHGDLAKEEAHPLRIFMVVRDFLSILDRVCKEVGKVNERTLVGFRQYPMPANPMLPAVFPENIARQLSGSSDDGSSRSL